MIKKTVFENDLILGMHKELIKQATNKDSDNVEKAVDCLNSAIEIFEDVGMTSQANKVLNILVKIAMDENDAHGKPKKPKNPLSISDPHIKNLNSEKMIKNLKNHGTVFNMADDGQLADDIEIDNEEEKPEMGDFEDEI